MQQLPQPGERFGAYVLEEVLAAGGQGTVYRGRHASLQTPVAVKILHAPDPSTLARFQREAQTLATLRHPGLVRVEDLGRSQGGFNYLVMDFVAGQTLQDRVRLGGPLQPEEALELLSPVAEALIHCHSLGILHRDVKPENILLSATGPLLVDFGLVRRDPTASAPQGEAEAQRLTQTGEILGTPSYMAPEQADGGRAKIEPTCDVYGLAATLYFALTGEPPFEAGSLFATLNKVLNDAPPDPRALCPVPAALAELCLESLAKDPAERPSTEEFARRLRESLSAPEGAGRGVLAAGVALSLLLLAAAGIAVALLPTSPPAEEAASSPDATVGPRGTSTPSPAPSPPATPVALASALPSLSSPTPRPAELPPLPQTWRMISSDSPRWTPRRQPSAVAWRDRLWVFPELGDAGQIQGGTYSSIDLGHTWEPIRARGKGAESPPQRVGSLLHKGELYRLGGYEGGNAKFPTVKLAFRDSLLGLAAAGNSPYPYSRDMNGVSFKNETYVFGASSIDSTHEGPDLYSNVSFQMRRGVGTIHFKEIRRPAWGPRYGARVLSHRGRIWVLGGRLHDPGVKPRHCHEVWSTRNPTRGWEQVEVKEAFPPTSHFGACVWRGRMWIGGGANLRSRGFVLWHSVDGVRWEALKLPGLSPPTRSSTSLVPLDEDTLFLIGGQTGGTGSTTKTTNDVWMLQ